MICPTYIGFGTSSCVQLYNKKSGVYRIYVIRPITANTSSRQTHDPNGRWSTTAGGWSPECVKGLRHRKRGVGSCIVYLGLFGEEGRVNRRGSCPVVTQHLSGCLLLRPTAVYEVTEADIKCYRVCWWAIALWSVWTKINAVTPSH